MKNVKKTKRAVSVIVWAAAIFTLFWWTAPEQQVDRFVAKNAETLEAAFSEDLSGDYSQGVDVRYTCWGRYGAHPIGEFSFGSSLLHGRQYYGCYYSPDDEPRGFQSVEVTLVPDGKDRWTWRAEGDNRGMTKKITDRWYYFEAWL